MTSLIIIGLFIFAASCAVMFSCFELISILRQINTQLGFLILAAQDDRPRFLEMMKKLGAKSDGSFEVRGA